MLPFSIALQRTGGVDLAADALQRVDQRRRRPGGARRRCSPSPPLLGMFISNTATAVLMAPVAIAIAKERTSRPIRSR